MARKIFIFGIANHSRSLSRSGKNNWYKNFFFKNEDNYSVLLAGAVDVSLIMVVTLFFLLKWVAEIDVMRRNNCSHETSDISSSATFVLLNDEDTYDRKKRKHFHLVPCTQLKLLSFAIELLNRCLS